MRRVLKDGLGLATKNLTGYAKLSKRAMGDVQDEAG
jgi:hypothetical protein